MLYQLSYFRILCDFTYLWLVDISRLKDVDLIVGSDGFEPP